MSENFSEGNVPLRVDPLRRLTVKLINAVNGGGSGGGGGGGGATNPPPGVVNPNGNVTGAPGAFYFNSANFTVWVQAGAVTANTGWIQTQ